MLGTYASLLVVLGASALVGQAILVASGHRDWSWLSPAIGLAALCALAWWTVRLPGEGIAAIAAIGVAAVLAAGYLYGRVRAAGAAGGGGGLIALAAVALASLPFIIEGRFGILGTGLNPDMSQHLFAADRLAAGLSERLISSGYPLGPHSLAVAVAKLGPSTVHAFDGLMIAGAVAACLAAAVVLYEMKGWLRFSGALVAGFAYLVAAYFVQGAFKETLQALFLVAFAVWLLRLSRPEPDGDRPSALRAVPLAVLGIGSVYVYSFPGLLWLAGALGVWALVELVRVRRAGGGGEVRRAATALARPAGIAAGVFGLAVLPEVGRMVDFASFETFNPAGSGLGNLFNRLSPLEALGIWPSGDFRVEPGDGSVPAVVFYLGAAAGLAALGFGLSWWWRRGDRALPAALTAAAALWLYALIAGTPYQEAKALVLLAPLVAMIGVRALCAGAPALLAAAFLAASGGSSALVLANGPVGPSAYSPDLAELRPTLGPGAVVVYAPPELLDEQHGRDYLVWELRGNRICVAPEGAPAPAGVRTAVSVILDDDGAVMPEGVIKNRSQPAAVESECPFIADGDRADPSAAAG